MSSITRVLSETSQGDRVAADQLAALVYDELRVRARNYLKGERTNHSLQPTALVHEAYLKLVGHDHVDWKGRTHFFAAAATAMRHVLIDHARNRNRAKRGGGATSVVLDDSVSPVGGQDIEILALYEAIDHLRSLNERHAKVVELRFFAGLTNDEVASLMDLSRATIELDWKFARAWLRRELSQSEEPSSAPLDTDVLPS